MAEHKLTADGSSAWYKVTGEVHISGTGTFGGGSLALEKLRGGLPVPILESGASLIYTTEFDNGLGLGFGDKFRFTLTGSTSPDLIAGAFGGLIETIV